MTTRGQKRTNQIAASLDATDDTANNAPSTNKRTKKPTRKAQANASANSRASTGASANIEAQSNAEASTKASTSTGPAGIDSAGATSSKPIQVDAMAAIHTQLGEMQRQITQAHQNTERERVRTQQLEVQLAEANRPHSTPPVSQPMAPATDKEMKAVLIALDKWLPIFAGSHLHIHNDNQAVCEGLKKLSIKGQAMEPLRKIAILLAQHDVLITVIWVDSKSNSLADMLSRLQYDKIADIYPQLQGLEARRRL